MINIVLTGNDVMFDGVFLLSVSLAKRTKEEVMIYLLTMDFTHVDPKYRPFTAKQEKIINDTLKTINPSVKFKIIDTRKMYEEYLQGNPNEGNRFSPFAALRLLIPYLDVMKDVDKMIYLDCDIMFYRDVKEFYDVDMENFELGVVRDYLGRFWMSRDYFNSGVMLINLKECRKTKLFDCAIEMVKSHKMTFPDQSALNILAKRLKYLPYKFNEQRSIKEDTVLKHFNGGIKYFPFFHVYNIKQWHVDKVHKVLKIHEFDDEFALYQEVKNKLHEKDLAKYKRRDEKYILQIKHLIKTYGDLKAVNDISFKVKRGSLFAFLGVNGAGKSTTINIISSILNKDYGTIIIDGKDLDKERDLIKREIGIVFQYSALDLSLTVEENLRIRANFYGLSKKEVDKRIKDLTDMLHLAPILNRQVRRLSGGQRRRVDIARSMLHAPKLLILDEPTTGLDPKTRIDVWKLIMEIREKQNMTVFLTTHYLEEAEMATDVVIMDHGEIIATGTPTELKNLYSKNYVIVYSHKNEQLDKLFLPYNAQYNEDQKAYKVAFKNSEEAMRFLKENENNITDFEVKKGDMDDVFLNVTGKAFKERNGSK